MTRTQEVILHVILAFVASFGLGVLDDTSPASRFFMFAVGWSLGHVLVLLRWKAWEKHVLSDKEPGQ